MKHQAVYTSIPCLLDVATTCAGADQLAWRDGGATDAMKNRTMAAASGIGDTARTGDLTTRPTHPYRSEHA